MKLLLCLLASILIASPVFAEISSRLNPGECMELVPDHVACCGDNKCSTSAFEKCDVCPEDCFCAPNFECQPLMTDENGNSLADDRGCAPAGYNTQLPDNTDTSQEPACCGSLIFILAPLALGVFKR
ncbi:Uncharacterised protein [Candidatus Bilamarchaeum dharawalense]|uniref:Uncharacterized protein n=1 Tax=Candidatus Bilamarchaeum dharawalense TaxID=2885759 RepID=A0A5E4LTY4_9ARCH|nr:Uncharacterised protein [Candidatus Bilamarchaeum dharawalense]